MALNFAHGAVQWLAADAATTNYVVTGVGFTPKALRFYWMGLGSATDTASQATFSRRGMGFATSTSDRRCVGSQDQDAALAMTCTAGVRADAIAATFTSTPAVDGLLDITAIGSDGFTLTVDDQAPVNITVFWEAWGGGDIANAVTGEISEPAATGVVAYTTGFRPDHVMFAGVQATGATPSAQRVDSGFCVGFGFSNDPDFGNIACASIVGNNDDSSASADADSAQAQNVAMQMITVGGGTASATAVANTRSATSFSLFWSARATTNRKSIYLAIQGGVWAFASVNINGGTIGNTVTTPTTLPYFYPSGFMFAGIRSGGLTQTEDVMSLGSATPSTSNRRAMGHWCENGTAASEIDLAIEYDAVLVYPTNAGAAGHTVDINAVNQSGTLQLIVDVAGGGSSDVIIIMAFGSTPKPAARRAFHLPIGA